jgi:hypothetical protein
MLEPVGDFGRFFGLPALRTVAKVRAEGNVDDSKRQMHASVKTIKKKHLPKLTCLL